MATSTGRFIAVVLMMTLMMVSIMNGSEIPSSYFKNVQGPPSEFANFADPTPADASLVSDSFMMEIALQQQGDKASWQGMIPVDSLDHVAISIVGPDAKYMNLRVVNIDDVVVNELQEANIENYNQAIKAKNHVVNTWMGYDKHSSVPAKVFNFNNNDQVKTGDWIIEVSLDSQAPQAVQQKYQSKKDTSKADLMLIIYNSSPLTAHTQSINMNAVLGEKIGFITRVTDKTEAEKRERIGVKYVPKAIPAESFEHIEAEIDVQYPDGKEDIVPMHSTSFAGIQALEHQGAFSGEFVATEKGIFHFRVVVKGVVGAEMRKTLFKSAKFIDPQSPKITFMRTTQHIIAIVDKEVQLVKDGALASFTQADEMMTVNLQAKKLLPSAEPKKYKAFAEVWAVSKTDASKLVPVCYTLGMTISSDSQELGKDYVSIPLQFSMKWLSKANAMLPLTLKNIKIQDVDTSSAISELDEVSSIETHSLLIDTETKKVNHRLTEKSIVHSYINDLLMDKYAFEQVTETMLMGPRPKQLTLKARARNSNHKVILVHGYCSAGDPFTASHFQNAIVFSDPNQSRSNDKFAQMIWEVAKDLDSFAVVAHSQGGMAGVHLYTFYWSTADNIPTNANIRLLQSVGTPYGGCSAAGSIANLGKVFGAGCGSNTDLSPDGASKWLKTIPEASQKKVYYYTTQNKKDGSSCHSMMDWILYKPNDGTSEIRYTSALTSANNMGLKYGWCHTTDMNYPPQCTDPDRNAELNKYANGF
ncbi:predicted protein [Naegleria gruberi]|uniref:Predicted protein n=1 Tax=Naegleria gruberi TaxID=5762 RepID=D2UZC1_NAEGR|nr:uncharacterized protein NAEGRDRAFT_56613 [Naegleria gruberi]EFC49922.1 predicted protein [Naegleria gruberi]|eukprot:XP_002682666.1 predicted protein [Naegleria gruberi strain NEG-M]